MFRFFLFGNFKPTTDSIRLSADIPLTPPSPDSGVSDKGPRRLPGDKVVGESLFSQIENFPGDSFLVGDGRGIFEDTLRTLMHPETD